MEESSYSESEEEQCPIDQSEQLRSKINEKFESTAVKNVVEKALKNQKVAKEYERLKEQLEAGVNPLDLGKKTTRVGGNKVYIKKDYGRYLVEVFDDRVEVLVVIKETWQLSKS